MSTEGTEAIDAALVGVFEWRDGAEAELAALGPAAFHRVHELYTTLTPKPPRLAELIAGQGRESIDNWTVAMHAVAVANPGLFVDTLGDELTINDALFLREVADPRAVGLLAGALGSADWLVRYHATRSLAARAEPEVLDLLRIAADDSVATVRIEACTGIGRRDPAQARTRLLADLASGAVPERLRWLVDDVLAQL